MRFSLPAGIWIVFAYTTWNFAEPSSIMIYRRGTTNYAYSVNNTTHAYHNGAMSTSCILTSTINDNSYWIASNHSNQYSEKESIFVFGIKIK